MLGYYIDIQCVQLQMPNTYALGLTKTTHRSTKQQLNEREVEWCA